MTTKNLGELFREAKKNQPVQKIDERNRKKRTPIIDNKSGIFHVSKQKGLTYKRKHFFKFMYQKNGKKATIQRKTLIELYNAVKELGYDFEVIDEKQAIAFINNNCHRKDFNFLCRKLCLTEGVLS